MTTLFHTASISKPFVATALMQLVEKGQVQLDAPFVTYLPDFKLADDRYRRITVQRILARDKAPKPGDRILWTLSTKPWHCSSEAQWKP